MTEEALLKLPTVEEVATIWKPSWLENHHTVPKAWMEALNINPNEWDQCPAYVLDQIEHRIGNKSFHKILDKILVPSKQYEKDEILRGLQKAYSQFGAPHVWEAARAWLVTEGIQ